MKNIIDTVVEDAVEIAHNQVAEKSILKGATDDFIAEITSLTLKEVQEMRLKINNK